MRICTDGALGANIGTRRKFPVSERPVFLFKSLI
jgi:hypothetical protein